MGKFTSAVILAAGNGTRFGGKVKKQFVEVLGVPCVVRTVEAFEKCDLIDEIILVGDTAALSEMLEPYSFKKVSRFVPAARPDRTRLFEALTLSAKSQSTLPSTMRHVAL